MMSQILLLLNQTDVLIQLERFRMSKIFVQSQQPQYGTLGMLKTGIKK